jgi:hemerythrin
MRKRQARTLSWSDSFAVGHAELDAQHRGLVKAINRVDAALGRKQGREQLAKALTALREKALRHVRDENALLWDIKSGRYDAPDGWLQVPGFLQAMAASALDRHMAAHYALLAQLEAIIAGPREALSDSLKKWFVDHAVKHDLPMKAIFQALWLQS